MSNFGVGANGMDCNFLVFQTMNGPRTARRRKYGVRRPPDRTDAPPLPGLALLTAKFGIVAVPLAGCYRCLTRAPGARTGVSWPSHSSRRDGGVSREIQAPLDRWKKDAAPRADPAKTYSIRLPRDLRLAPARAGQPGPRPRGNHHRPVACRFSMKSPPPCPTKPRAENHLTGRSRRSSLRRHRLDPPICRGNTHNSRNSLEPKG